MTSRAVAVSIALVTATSLVAVGQRRSAALAPPSLYLSATSADLLTFAGAAVSRGVPVGVVVDRAVRKEKRRQVTRFDDTRDRNLGEVIRRFNATHLDYLAELTEGRLLIREQALPGRVTGILSKRHDVALDRVPSYRALFRIGDLLAIGPDMGGGFIGTAPPDSCPTDVPITITRHSSTTKELLDSIAKQAGVGWMLFYDMTATTDSLELGYLCPDGSFTYFTVRGW